MIVIRHLLFITVKDICTIFVKILCRREKKIIVTIFLIFSRKIKEVGNILLSLVEKETIGSRHLKKYFRIRLCHLLII